MTDLALSVPFRLINCGADGCGIQFAMPLAWYEARCRDHAGWYCPNGHRRAFLGKSEAEKLRDELAAAQRETERARASRDEEARIRRGVERQLSATRGVVTRTKRRVGHGVCPCCKRTFSALARHMESKHPGYASDDASESVARGS